MYSVCMCVCVNIKDIIFNIERPRVGGTLLILVKEIARLKYLKCDYQVIQHYN